MAAAAAAPDLDCLIAAHERFLCSVLDRALLGGGPAEALRHTLTQLLSNCMDLAGPVKQLREKVWLGCCLNLATRAFTAHIAYCVRRARCFGHD